MIFGIGVDMVRVSRMSQGYRRFGARLPRRILSRAELDVFLACARQPRFLAQRFAAKEAAAKALGTGFGSGVFPRDIAVLSDKRGKPLLRFSGHTLGLIRRLDIVASQLSLTDEEDYAIAMVTLERC